MLSGVRLLSLDIFDTLLLRATAHPHDVFLEVGRRALANGWLPAHLTPAHVRALRVDAEQRARLAKNPQGPAEVTLDEIWTAMPFASAHVERLTDLEVTVEAGICFRNPVIWSLVEEARGRDIPVVLVSDMYLSPAQIARLLRQNGCPLTMFDALLVSSEGEGAKWNGQLFERLCSLYPEIRRHEMLHIGDNARSDVEQARQAGLQAHHYSWTNPRLDEVTRRESLRHGSAAPSLLALRRVAAATGHQLTEHRDWFELGATVLGPFVSAFADWVVDQCAATQVRTVRPLMREGALLTEVIRAAARARGIALDVQPLWVSRASTWLAGLERVDEQVIDERVLDDLCGRPHLTVREAARALGFDVLPAPLAAIADHVLAASDARTAGSPAALFRAFALTADAQSRVAIHARDARRQLVRYLAQAAGDAGVVALVDLGFHGTTGRAIERIAASRLDTRWCQMLAIGSPSVERLWLAGADVRVFLGGPGGDTELVAPLIAHAAVLEALLVTGATTVGYTENAGTIEPQRSAAQMPDWQEEALESCHRGIRAFQRIWLGAHTQGGATMAQSLERRTLVEILHRLVELPTLEEATALGALVHQHNGGSDAQERLVAAAPPPGADAEDFLLSHRQHARAYGRTWLWPQGAVTQRWPRHLIAPWEGVRGDHGPASALTQLARRARRQGVRRCVVYGAGDAGRTLAAALRDEQITVTAFVDRNDRLWGQVVDGAPVVAPATALAGSCHTYVVGSLAFASQIESDLRTLYAARLPELRVLSTAVVEERPHAA